MHLNVRAVLIAMLLATAIIPFQNCSSFKPAESLSQELFSTSSSFDNANYRKADPLLLSRATQFQSGADFDGPVVHINPTNYTLLPAVLVPGSQIILSDGNWENVQLSFHGERLLIRSQTFGLAVIRGLSRLTVTGHRNVVYGLRFTDGDFIPGYRTASGQSVANIDKNVIFRLGNAIAEQPCDECIVSDLVMQNIGSHSNDPETLALTMGMYLDTYGRNSTIAYSTFSNMRDRGHYVSAMDLPIGSTFQGLHFYRNVLKDRTWPAEIINDPEAPADIIPNGYETLQLGGLGYLNQPLYSVVEDNTFENNTPTMSSITLKAGNIIFRGNTFLETSGPILFRAANNVLVEKNYFYGNRLKKIGTGLSISGSGHRIVQNYFQDNEGLKAAPIRLIPGMVEDISDIPATKADRGVPRAKNIVIAGNIFVNNWQAVRWAAEYGAGIGDADFPLGYYMAPQKILFKANTFEDSKSADQQFVFTSAPGIADEMYLGRLENGEISNQFIGNTIVSAMTGLLENDSRLSINVRNGITHPRSKNRFSRPTSLLGTLRVIPKPQVPAGYNSFP